MRKFEHTFPTRLPVWWARFGEPMAMQEIAGVSGRRVMIRILKSAEEGRGLARLFHLLEELMFRITKGPRELRRPLDEMNSLLWELCDGSRRFDEICDCMDSAFHESIAPVAERTQVAIIQFEALGFIAVLERPFDRGWPTGPGVSPRNHLLPDADELLGLDTAPLEGETTVWSNDE